MGYIKEPVGIDFVIKSKPLTAKQRQDVSAFIKADKARLTNSNKHKKSVTTNRMRGITPSDTDAAPKANI